MGENILWIFYITLISVNTSCFYSLPLFIMSRLAVFFCFNCCLVLDTSDEKWRKVKTADSYGKLFERIISEKSYLK